MRRKYPHAFPLSESQLDILEQLAKDAPVNPNQLSRTLKKAYSFVYNTLIEMEDRKILTLQWEKSEKGIDMRMYDLDLEGILLVLHMWMRNSDLAERNHSTIIRIIEKHASKLPLVFGKWQFLRESMLEDIALTRLKFIVDTHRASPFRRGIGSYPWLEMRQQITRFFYLFDFYSFDDSAIGGFDFKTWIMTMKKDEEIRAFVLRELKHDLRKFRNHQVILEKIISFMESLQ